MITLTDTQWQEYEYQLSEMTRQLRTAHQQIADLTSQLSAAQQQIADLTSQLDAAAQQIGALTGQLDGAHKRVAELEVQKKPPPSFVKANRPERGTKVRKKRAPEHNHARQREEPAQMMTHGIERCPECQGRLSGLHVGRRRQVIEMPAPPPVEIIEHQVQRGWCSYYHAWREAQLDLGGRWVGQSRVGVRLTDFYAGDNDTPARRGPQDQWWQSQSARQPHPHGPRQSHADLARPRSQSLPPISRPFANSFPPTLNSYDTARPCHFAPQAIE